MRNLPNVTSQNPVVPKWRVRVCVRVCTCTTEVADRKRKVGGVVRVVARSALPAVPVEVGPLPLLGRQTSSTSFVVPFGPRRFTRPRGRTRPQGTPTPTSLVTLLVMSYTSTGVDPVAEVLRVPWPMDPCRSRPQCRTYGVTSAASTSEQLFLPQTHTQPRTRTLHILVLAPTFLHARAHTRTRTHVLVLPHRLGLTLGLALSNVLTYSHVHTLTYVFTPTRTLTNTFSFTLTPTHSHVFALTCQHTYSRRRTHVLVRTLVHPPTHTYSHSHVY